MVVETESRDALLSLRPSDRRVDPILVAGSNVHPAEIPAVRGEHLSVADVAVCGIPDPDWVGVH